MIYFMLTAIACVIGFIGCWSVSSSRISATAILLLISGFSAIAGMALFHVAEHYELNSVRSGLSYENRVFFCEHYDLIF